MLPANVDPYYNQRFHYLTASARLSGTTSAMIFLYMWRGLFFVVHSSFQLHTFVILDLYWQLKYRCISLTSVCTMPSCLLHSEPNAHSWVFVFVVQTYIYNWISIYTEKLRTRLSINYITITALSWSLAGFLSLSREFSVTSCLHRQHARDAMGTSKDSTYISVLVLPFSWW